MTNNIEIEARFIDIDKDTLISRLKKIGARDLGEDLLKEMIFYPKGRKEKGESMIYTRIRTRKGKHIFSYKHRTAQTIDGTQEIEFETNDSQKTRDFLEATGWEMVRSQEKLRHTFILDGVTLDFDTWPNVSPYLEVEGDNKESLKKVAERLGLSWEDAIFEGAGRVLEKYLHVPVFSYTYFTFEKQE